MKKQQGLSYIEVLVATVLIAITLVPMMEALQPGLQSSEQHRQQTLVYFAIRGQVETLLAEPFEDLKSAATAAGSHDVETSYSDAGASVPYRVYLWPYDVDDVDGDGNVFTNGADDLLWLRVASGDESYAIETLVSQ